MDFDYGTQYNYDPSSQCDPQPQTKDSNVIELEIIFKDSSSSTKTNKELIKYFKNNLDSLNRSGIKFIWRISNQEEQKIYKQRGIKNLPALVISDNQIKYGAQNIIREIGTFINQRKKLIGDPAVLGDGMAHVSDEALYEYQKRLIGTEKDTDRDNPDDSVPDFRSREMDMMRRRKAAGMFHGETQATSDNDDQDYDPYRVQTGGRNDNIPMRNDPSYSLQKLRNIPGTDSHDADLLQMHLDKMDPSITSMDYI